MLIQVDPQVKAEVEQKKFLEGLYWELREGRELEKFHYLKKRRELGKENQGKAGMVEGLGQHTASYDARQWFRWQEEDKYFWQDESNVKKFKQDNPEVLVTKH
jgi:hypothetical protein